MSEQSGDMTAAFSSALESASTPVADASPASTPTTEATPSETTPAAATAQPEGQDQPPASVSPESVKAEGEPPQWRWQDILETQRKKAAQEAEERVRQEIQQQYGWAQEFQPDEVQNVAMWARALKSDPVAAFRQLQSLLEGHPQYGAQLKPQSAEADQMPEADLQAADGTLVYSAPQMQKWQEWNTRRVTQQIEQQLSQKFQPLIEDSEAARARQADERQKAEQHQWAAKVFAPIVRQPFFKELKPELEKRLSEGGNGLNADQLQEFVWDTYAELLKAKLDSQSKSTESQVLANLQQRAVAGSVSPNAAVTTTPKRFQPGQQGFAEALQHFAGSGR